MRIGIYGEGNRKKDLVTCMGARKQVLINFTVLVEIASLSAFVIGPCGAAAASSLKRLGGAGWPGIQEALAGG